jgi:signal peptide peptidase SppA
MSVDRFPFLAQRLFNSPLAITEDKAEIVMAGLADRLGITRLFNGGIEVNLGDARMRAAIGPGGRQDDRDVGYDLAMGVAIVPVTGTLVAKLGTMRPYSGMTGYDGIRHNLLSAVSSAAVRAVMLDIDSPGGEVRGCFDLADTVYALRGTKPIWAVLSESAYSAAYAIASAADRITVPRTGGTGSIGVISMHTDLSRSLDKAGISVTIIRSGAQKMERNPVEPLSEGALSRIQAEVDETNDIFVATVARNRGLTEASVRGLQGATVQGARGVQLGLADAVMAPDAAFRALVASLG